MHVIRISILFLLLLAPAANGQAVLTLRRCLDLAAAHSVEARQAALVTDAAELARRELNTARYPAINARVAATVAPWSASFGYDPALSNGGEFVALVEARQPVYDAGMRALRDARIGLDIDRSLIDRRIVERDMTLAVTLAFIEALRAALDRDLARQAVEQLDAHMELVLRLNKSGVAPAADLMRTEIQAASARIALASADEAIALAKLALAGLIGRPADTSFAVEGDIASLLPPGEAETPIDFEHSALLASVERDAQRASIDIELAARERLPQVTATADAGWMSSGENLRLPASERYAGFGVSVGIAVDAPVTDWGAVALRRQQREIAAHDIQLRAELLRRSMTTEDAALRVSLTSALSRLATVRENITRAADAFLLIKSQYAAGAALAIEVLSARQSVSETRGAELRALADIQIMRARLRALRTE